MLSIRKSLLHCSYRVKGYYAAHCSSCNGYLTTLNIKYLASSEFSHIIHSASVHVNAGSDQIPSFIALLILLSDSGVMPRYVAI